MPKRNPQPPAAEPKETAVANAPRNVIYPDLVAMICNGDKAITVDQAKALLGWHEEDDKVKFGGDYLLTDIKGTKIRCLNNVTNRPYYNGVADTLKQEHLQRRWRFNGEPIIIGRTGLILNGQHTLISLILAAQTWAMDDHWKGNWPTEPTLEKLIVYGVDEGDDTVNTMDTCKPRSLADVIYRSAYFAGKTPADRRACARMTDYAIRLLWNRTGVGLDAFAPRRTHSEALDFIGRHERLLQAVAHIYEENQPRKNEDGTKGAAPISEYLSAGYASALLYLMGCSRSDAATYHAVSPAPHESVLDWSLWDKASDFWVLFAQASPVMHEVRMALGALTDPDEGGEGSMAEKLATLAKAWAVFATDKEYRKPGKGDDVSPDLKLEYTPKNDEGIRSLKNPPTFGGIDMGDNPQSKEEATAPPPVPKEESAAAKAKREKAEEVKRKFEEQKERLEDNREKLKNGEIPPSKNPIKPKLKADPNAAPKKPAAKAKPEPAVVEH